MPPPMRKFSAVDAVQRVVLWQTFAIWRDAVTDNSSSKVTRDASFAPQFNSSSKLHNRTYADSRLFYRQGHCRL